MRRQRAYLAIPSNCWLQNCTLLHLILLQVLSLPYLCKLLLSSLLPLLSIFQMSHLEHLPVTGTALQHGYLLLRDPRWSLHLPNPPVRIRPIFPAHLIHNDDPSSCGTLATLNFATRSLDYSLWLHQSCIRPRNRHQLLIIERHSLPPLKGQPVRKGLHWDFEVRYV